MKQFYYSALAILVAVAAQVSAAGAPVKLASLPALSPDGATLVFEYGQDLWKVSSEGGRAVRLTQHPAFNTRPVFSPDGTRLAFSSNRDDSWQTYVMPAEGGNPRQVTFHSEGSTPLDWFPDGEHLLVRGRRDYRGYMQTRFFKVSAVEHGPEANIFDAYGVDACLAPDGDRILFTRFGESLYRKGYRGSAASQIWLHDFETGEFRRVGNDPSGCRSPLWRPDGEGFYFLTQRDAGCFNVWEHDLTSGEERRLTHFTDASVIIPGLSRDGGTMVFRQLFDFYRMDPRNPESLRKLDITIAADDQPPELRRRWYKNIGNNDSGGTVDFTDDALEICFTTGGDLWVMDTVLREPKLVCGETATHEREAVFGPDGRSIYFLRDDGLGVNIWKATPADPDRYWWRNDNFKLTQITDDRLYRFNLGLSARGDRITVVQGSYELWHYDLDGEDGISVCTSPYKIYYDWAPDDKWLTVSMRDSWGNSDVWIAAADGGGSPFNLSRHPNWDSNARWSPDGRIIAFTGKRFDGEIDIFYAYLRKTDEMRSERDRRLRKAIESMESKRKTQPKPEEEKRDEPVPEPPEEVDPDQTERSVSDSDSGRNEDDEVAEQEESSQDIAVAEEADTDAVKIDFDGLSKRIHRIEIPGATPSHLFWSYDSKVLAFQSTIAGKRGTYKVAFAGSLKPEFMCSDTGEQARWIKDGSRILWMNDSLPAIYNRKLPFEVYQETNIPEYKRLGFRIVWRNLRDNFYDPALNNLDWDAIRLKYEDMASAASNWDVYQRVVDMLLGELNASHLGFDRTGGSGKEWYSQYDSGQWRTQTSHLGLIFDSEWAGPGLEIDRVIPGGPSDTRVTGIEPGDIVIAIDGVQVGPDYDLAQVLTGRSGRVTELLVEAATGARRAVVIESAAYTEIRKLIREDWIESMEEQVAELSDGRLGYLNIEKMNNPSLRRFEREVFACGFDRDGLVIDVRNNGGGFVADQILAILCHPEHAFTVPRGGSRSYQQGYLNTSFWSKPIVVLCNQYSASNAEIFCHAIKTLGRGQIVGVPTRGAVISMPSEQILDIGKMRVPNRGWFLPSGLDMEIQPCEPDHYVEAFPGDIPSGRDPQLRKAVEVLLEDAARSIPPPKPIYASEYRAALSGEDE